MSFNELGSSRPKFTERIQREVYPAIDPTQPALSVAGKTILVTGAARGLGVTIVDSFAKAHAKVIVLTGRAEAPLNDARLHLEKEYPKTKFIAFSVDIGVPESVAAMFEHLKGHVQQIDVLINNAGVLNEYGPKLGDTDGDKFWADMTVNTRGPYLLSHGLINFNTANYPATFITLTTGVTEPYPSMTGYFLSKLPQIKLAQILDLEYPNLRAYAVMPGINETDMLLDAFRPFALDKPTLIGGLSVYLCSPVTDFLSGRFLDARWDIEQVVERKEEIVKNDWLKLQIAGY